MFNPNTTPFAKRSALLTNLLFWGLLFIFIDILSGGLLTGLVSYLLSSILGAL